MSGSVPQVYGRQDAYMQKIPNTAQWQPFHTCSDQSDLTDAKIKGMDLAELLRLQSQLQLDIKKFTHISLQPAKTYDDKGCVYAAKCGLNIDTATLAVVNEEINVRRATRDHEQSVARVMAKLMDLTLRVEELEKRVPKKDEPRGAHIEGLEDSVSSKKGLGRSGICDSQRIAPNYPYSSSLACLRARALLYQYSACSGDLSTPCPTK